MDDKRNLLQETIEILHEHGRTPNDVRWVGNQEGTVVSSWQSFEAVADFEYDSGYGGNEVQLDLVIVGEDWWLERGEYDGREWWEFKRLPERAQASTALELKHVSRHKDYYD